MSIIDDMIAACSGESDEFDVVLPLGVVLVFGRLKDYSTQYRLQRDAVVYEAAMSKPNAIPLPSLREIAPTTPGVWAQIYALKETVRGTFVTVDGERKQEPTWSEIDFMKLQHHLAPVMEYLVKAWDSGQIAAVLEGEKRALDRLGESSAATCAAETT